jgi:hypothetical protein
MQLWAFRAGVFMSLGPGAAYTRGPDLPRVKTNGPILPRIEDTIEPYVILAIIL